MRRQRRSRIPKKKKGISKIKVLYPFKKNGTRQYLKKAWFYIAAISILVTILSLPFLIKEYKKLFSSEHEVYVDEHFIKGILIPNYNHDDSSINIGYGSFTFAYLIKNLKNGVHDKEKRKELIEKSIQEFENVIQSFKLSPQ